MFVQVFLRINSCSFSNITKDKKNYIKIYKHIAAERKRKKYKLHGEKKKYFTILIMWNSCFKNPFLVFLFLFVIILMGIVRPALHVPINKIKQQQVLKDSTTAFNQWDCKSMKG